MSMILRNTQGDEVEREVRLKLLENSDDGDKFLTIFEQPLDVKGTVFFSFSHAIEPDDVSAQVKQSKTHPLAQ
jgi:hypothetical protein